MLSRESDTFTLLLNDGLAEKEQIFKLSKAILDNKEELVVQLLVNADDYDRLLDDELRKKVKAIIKGIVHTHRRTEDNGSFFRGFRGDLPHHFLGFIQKGLLEKEFTCAGPGKGKSREKHHGSSVICRFFIKTEDFLCISCYIPRNDRRRTNCCSVKTKHFSSSSLK